MLIKSTKTIYSGELYYPNLDQLFKAPSISFFVMTKILNCAVDYCRIGKAP